MSFNKYPYTDFHEMNDDWVILKVKELIAAWAETKADWEQVQSDWADEQQAFQDLKDYVNTYFADLDVQTEINNKLDAMAEAGTLAELMAPYVPNAVATWLSAHVDPETGYVLDDSLTIEGAAADAKATGDAINLVSSALPSIAHKFYSVIPNGTDYDTLTTSGTYVVASRANALTMTNCPAEWAHKMYVVTTSATDRLYQIILTNDEACSVYMRYHQSTWSEWVLKSNTTDIPARNSIPYLTIDNGFWSLISNSTDYNSITTAGTYICISAVSAQTMTNCPTPWAHKMYVGYTSGTNKIYQIILANDVDVAIFKRFSADGGTSWGRWRKDKHTNDEYKLLVIGDSYSEQGRWINSLSSYINITSLVNLGVTSATVKDKYEDRTLYPYTSRPVKTDNTGNHNTFMCQIEKLKRLMEGADLDEGESQIYTTEDSYPNIIIIEGGQNDNPDTDIVVATYEDQFMQQVSGVYVSQNSEQTAEVGSTYIKLPSEDCDRTCFAGAYRSIVEELQTLFPKAQIFATSRSILGYWNSERFPNATEIRKQQELCCNMTGIDFINWQSGPQINLMNNYPKGSGTADDPYCFGEVAGSPSTHDTYDLLHPFALGAKKYAKVVANAIENNFMDMENM